MNKEPNILLIVIDATRARNLSCYGYARATSPNLDRLAAQGVLYEQAITSAGWSLPAHASLFTGLYASRHGADDQHKYLQSDHLTLAEMLSARGYCTLAFCDNPYVGPATGLDRGFQWFNRSFNSSTRPASKKIAKLTRRYRNALAKARGEHDSGAANINRHVLESLQRLKGQSSPFFMFMHYEDTHAPYRLPEKFARFLPKNIELDKALKVNQDPWKHLIDPKQMSEEDFQILRALYDSEIYYVDYRIGQVLNTLQAMDMYDNTLIIVTADHGENIGDHGMMAHKYCLYDTLMHVPLIIRYPSGVTNPGRVQHQVQTLDIVPTILSMLRDTDSPVFLSLQGYDLLSSYRREFTIAEQSRPDLSKFYTRFPGVDVSRFDRALTMIRDDRYKFIWASDGRHELYDRKSDPSEEHNVIDVLPHVAANLEKQLQEWQSGFKRVEVSTPAPEFDQEVVERLQALGYLE
ncbi:MAG: sulfatase [Chloroflexi bacterium]|nr:sulfatase [Chloroflexota bacterium]